MIKLSRMKFGKKPFVTFSLIALTILACWIDLPWHPSLQLGNLSRDLNVKLGLDLQGGSHLVYEADVKGMNMQEAADSLAGVRDVIERRVNAFGVSEPVIQTSRVGDNYRVIIELAGVHDPDEAIKIIRKIPKLDFRREVVQEEALKQFNIDDPSAITGPIFERTMLTGKNLKRSTVSFDQMSGTPEVNLEFDSEGSKLFAELTKQNIGRRIAIYLDGKPINAPVVQAEITSGRAVISGGFTTEKAKELAQRLNTGASPVPITLVSQQTIGPTLGKLSVEKSIEAGIIGLIAVILWMIIFYRLPGVISAVSLILYAIFFLAIVKLIPITLTLAGIAGFILSIGMAVDANVLIFERFRENIRAGKNITYALEHGFEEAWESIKASNVSSLITAIILYSFGTSIIRGFALTFSIGILLSMITAISITRALSLAVLRYPIVQKPFLLSVTPKEKD